jgi:hypothetical protein
MKVDAVEIAQMPTANPTVGGIDMVRDVTVAVFSPGLTKAEVLPLLCDVR